MNRKSMGINYVHVKKLSEEEQTRFYMQFHKKKLVEMLIEVNRINDLFIEPQIYTEEKVLPRIKND